MSKLLSQSSRRTVSKEISKIVGVEASLLLSDLCDQEEYYRSIGGLVSRDCTVRFYATSDKIEANTTITYRRQKTCINLLKKNDLIDCKLMGVPAKLHFSINDEKINNIITKKEEQDPPEEEDKYCGNTQTSIAENAKLELLKTQNIYKENNIKKINKENINIDDIINVDTDVSEQAPKLENQLLAKFGKKEIVQDQEIIDLDEEKITYGKKEISEVIKMMEDYLTGIGMVYKGTSFKSDGKTVSDRMLVSSMLRSKALTGVCKMMSLDPVIYLSKIMEHGVTDPFYASQLHNGGGLAKNRQSIHNKFMGEEIKKAKKNILSNGSR